MEQEVCKSQPAEYFEQLESLKSEINKGWKAELSDKSVLDIVAEQQEKYGGK